MSRGWLFSDLAFPHILVVGEAGASDAHYFVANDSETLMESQSMPDAILDLVAVYHVFEVPYPKQQEAVLIFLEHFVFGLNLRPNSSIPIITANFVTNLNRVSV